MGITYLEDLLFVHGTNSYRVCLSKFRARQQAQFMHLCIIHRNTKGMQEIGYKFKILQIGRCEPKE